MRFLPVLAGTVVLHGLLGATACAQRPAPAPTPTPAPEARAERQDRDDERDRVSLHAWSDESDRAVLGINTTSSNSERDTLGVLISSISPGGPAEKAGLEEGNRIAAVNGTNLRLAPADAGEDDMQGIASRRLTREMRKVKPGAEVSLRVYANGAFRDVKVKTVAADELNPRRVRLTRTERRAEMDNRAVLGLNLNATGSRRDTLGLMVVRVESDGPAEKAGVVEGDRVMSVNRVDLRVPRDDAGDDFVGNARLSRFRRALRDLKPGDRVELRLYSGGQTRTVQVTTVRAGDLYKEGERRAFYFGDDGDGMFFGPMGALAPTPPTPPTPPRPPMAPRVRIAPEVRTFRIDRLDDFDRFDDFDEFDRFDEFDHFDGAVQLDDLDHLDLEVDVEGLQDMREELERALESSRMEIRRALDGASAEARRARKDARKASETTREALERAREEAREELERAGLRSSLRSASADVVVDVGSLVSDAVLVASDVAAGAIEPALTVVDGVGTGEGTGWGSGWADGDGAGDADGSVMNASAYGDRYTLRLPGLRLAKVTPDLAATLGAGSERGLLVLDASDSWRALRAGDVLLEVNGTPVRDADRASVRFDRGRDNRVTVLRRGARMELEVPRD
jgi:serine protease Do